MSEAAPHHTVSRLMRRDAKAIPKAELAEIWDMIVLPYLHSTAVQIKLYDVLFTSAGELFSENYSYNNSKLI